MTMIDREKVIKGLEVCIKADFIEGKNPCAGCPYFFDGMCKYVIMKDALILLKEQAEIIDRYRKADAFLYAHGWRWDNV